MIMQAVDDRQLPSESWIQDIRNKFRVERTIDECLTRKLYNRRKSYDPPRLSEIEQGLRAFLCTQLGKEEFAFSGFRRLPGGASKQNYYFEMEWDSEGRSQRKEFLLRLDPGEAIVETHRMREFQLIKAVEGAIPVPRACWVDPEGLWLGRPFLICEFVRGLTQPESGAGMSGVACDYGHELRNKLGAQFIQIAATLHTLDWSVKDLSTLDVPKAGTTEAVEWNLAWWERVWEEDTLEDHPLVVEAHKWLTRNMPIVDKVSLVHGDLRTGNFIYDPATGKIEAFLDWELGHLGDFHEDLSWVLLGLFVLEDSGRPLVCALMPREEFLDRYEKLTGFKINREKLHYYEVFNNFKLGIITMASNARVAYGRRTHLDTLMNLVGCHGYACFAELAGLLAL